MQRIVLYFFKETTIFRVAGITAGELNAQAHDEGEADFNRLQDEKLEAEKALKQEQEPDCFASNPSEKSF